MAERIIEARDWEHLGTMIDASEMQLLWREVRLLNAIEVIQYKLCSVLESLYDNRQLVREDSLYRKILEHVARTQSRGWKRGDTADKHRRIRSEKRRLRKNYKSKAPDGKLLLNPAVLLDEAELALGKLNSLLASHGSSHSVVSGMMDDLRKLEEYRNQLCHNVSSSRRIPYKKLQQGNKIALKILEQIRQHFGI